MPGKIKPGSKRARALKRRPDGTFAEWKGGYTKEELPKKRNSFQGIAIHLGKEFVRQHGRRAVVGDIIRKKTKSGRYHKQAEWYVKTYVGWRKARTGTKKPTKDQIERIIKISRRGRK